jgi:sec-independent protein translocase protein TatB
MFDVGFSEFFLIAVVAIIAIGPEDVPDALFRFGRFVRQVKMFTNGIRNQYSDIMHEAEMQHYRKQLKPAVTEETPKVERISDDDKQISNDSK